MKLSFFKNQTIVLLLVAQMASFPVFAQTQLNSADGAQLKPPPEIQSPKLDIIGIPLGIVPNRKVEEHGLEIGNAVIDLALESSMIDQIKSAITNEDAFKCIEGMLTESPFKDIAGEIIGGLLVTDASLFNKPMEKDCGNIRVHMTPGGFTVSPEEVAKLQINKPGLAERLSDLFLIKKSHAWVSLVAGGAVLWCTTFFVTYEGLEVGKSASDAVSEMYGEWLKGYCLDHPTEDICKKQL